MFYIISDSEQASQYIEHLQARLWEQGDHSQDEELSSIIAMLESPLFHQLLTLQESLQELKEVTNTYPVSEETFEIAPSGEIILSVPPDSISNQPPVDSLNNYNGPESTIATPGYDLEFQRAIERAAQEREVETIKLFKPENSSLGFSVVGLKTDIQGELGIFVQDIQPGGIAAR